MKAIILAGGGGTRLWPVSRREHPKQFGAVVGSRSLLRRTFERLRRGLPVEDILVATAASQADQVRAELPELPAANLVLEPCRRDTAAAIGFALLHVAAQDPLATFVVINSDAHVQNVEEYLRAIRLAGREAERRHCAGVLIGITPSYPETGYGYIKTGEYVGRPDGGRDGDHLFAVEKFVEKPDLKTAEVYLAHGGFLWNPTLVVGCADRFLRLFDQHLPEPAAAWSRLRTLVGQPGHEDEVAAIYTALPVVSIDYGILEKAANLLVLPADFGWADVGNWKTVRDVLAERAGQNVIRGRHVGLDSRGNLILSDSDKLVATVGISDMVIIETPDAILVCPQSRAHEVKRLVAELELAPELAKFL